ncbi:hypothetical protein, partial [Gemmiger sp.]|uniref:hypothetical protein n=1 Tax=Gemmiger sp. TaxID=2049027 RepID=UPI0030797061
KPLILKGLQKKSQKISTQLLTVLIYRAIIEAFQGEQGRKNQNPKGTTKLNSKVNCTHSLRSADENWRNDL